MSLRPSPTTAADVPVARPALPALTVRVAEAPAPDVVPWWRGWFPRSSRKGWTTSLGVHALVLLAMAFWVLRPKGNEPPSFDTRLAGDFNGVDEGLTLTGGLNTEIDLVADMLAEPEPEPVPNPLVNINVEALGPKIAVEAPKAERLSVAGGIDNDNPGAGSGDGFGLAKFGQGGESIRGVEVKVGDPQFTLLWDTKVDLDLHVIEPGGKEIFWEEPKGRRGGELDVDNTKGFGPENVYWMHEDPDTGVRLPGVGPAGEYQWFVVYWGGFGGVPMPTRWRVRIKHAGKVTIVRGTFKSLNERSKVHTLKVETPAGPTP